MKENFAALILKRIGRGTISYRSAASIIHGSQDPSDAQVKHAIIVVNQLVVDGLLSFGTDSGTWKIEYPGFIDHYKPYKCQHCGITFYCTRAGKKYCSIVCCKQALAGKLPQYRLQCCHCEKYFISKAKAQKFCSRDCSIRSIPRVKPCFL